MTIHIEDLSYAYPESDWVLRDINLQIEQGECISIMGANGAGKSTMCMALNGIVPQATGGRIRGSVTVAGHDTKATPVANLAHTVGMVFQNSEAQLFSTSVEAEIAFGLENLGIDRSEMRERVEWSLDLLNIMHLRHRSPFKLSGGERQRLAIASVMATSPGVLVLDEPSANLDPSGEAELLAALLDLKKATGLTVILAEHNAELVAEMSDRIAILDQGMLIRIDTPEEIFSRVAEMHELGLGVPQVSELADCLNRHFNQELAFATYVQATSVLEALVRR